jgi:DNA repair protein RadD
MIELWDFQAEAKPRIVTAIEANRRTLICSPTGSGKTVMMSDLMHDQHKASKKIIAMAPRKELIEQLCEKLDTWGLMRYGLITAGSPRGNSYAPIQVCSLDTLVSRTVRRQSLILPDADYVHMDEAHLYLTKQRTQLMDMFPQSTKFIGWTATPGRMDGRPLGSMFDKMVGVIGIKRLIELGYLVKPRYLAPSLPDMDRVRTVEGDFDPKETAIRMMPLLGDIVGHWMKHAGDRRTVLFAANTQQSAFMAEAFRAVGVAAEHCDGSMQDQRGDIFKRFRSGETQVLCNVDLATYGFDLPELSCIIFARPTKSLVRYIQMMGRGMRRAPGKNDCLILDHAGNVHFHGYVEEERYWSLSGVKDPNKMYKTKSGEMKVRPVRNLICPKCSVVFAQSLTCPECGYFFETMAQQFCVVDGQLIPIQDDPVHAELERMQFYLELRAYAEDKGYKTGWASVTWKEKHGTWPPREWNERDPRPPGMATMRYIQYLNIRKAKSRRPSPH